MIYGFGYSKDTNFSFRLLAIGCRLSAIGEIRNKCRDVHSWRLTLSFERPNDVHSWRLSTLNPETLKP